MFGGNGNGDGSGNNGGLLNAVLDDPWIHRLGNIAHALDDSQKHVKLPHGSEGARGCPELPLFPVPVPRSSRSSEPGRTRSTRAASRAVAVPPTRTTPTSCAWPAIRSAKCLSQATNGVSWWTATW
jgi:hypothetical protein